jgi:ABC-type transport system involved in multi-copper enzyme maturation permease subunit
MNLPAALLAIGWMIRDTLRQSLATRIFWAMLFVSALCILFCLSISAKNAPRLPLESGESPMALPAGDPELNKKGPKGTVEGVDVLGGDELSLGFGTFHLSTNRGREDSVRFVQVWLASLVAGTCGIFLAIVWTAGFLPNFLDPQQATVLLAKPIPRWSLLLGKVLGVLIFVLIQTTFFVVGTWLALGIATGVFDARYLLAIPLLLLHFGVFYSFSAMLAVWTRSTVVCVFGTILFWSLCWGMNYGRHALVAHQPGGISNGSQGMMELGYWTLPKPGDLNMIFDDALETEGFSGGVPEFLEARRKDRINLPMSALASFLFGVAMFGIAAYEFKNAEY